MIDLHTHVLPGLDDGARTLDDSLALGRAAAEAGTTILVATPHVREDHSFELSRIRREVGALNRRFDEAGVSVEVVPGGEVSITKVIDLEGAELREAWLGEGPYVLVESPYTETGQLLERALFEAQVKGFRPVLAHPERSPCFLGDLARLSELVDRGILCSVTAGSMAGRFGGTVRDYTVRLLEAGLVHNVASDSHGASHRGPDLRGGFEALEEELPGLLEQSDWYTTEVPRAVIAGAEIPAGPPALVRRRGSRQRVMRRLRRLLGSDPGV